MEHKALVKVKESLEDVFKVLTDAGVVDNALRHRYAEYLVASVLSKKGYDVQLSNERANTKADIYLADKGISVEVKSGKCDKDGWAVASFGTGDQIKKRKFDYCVFLTFSKKGEGKVRDIFIFTRGELKGLRPRKEIAIHTDTNSVLLLLAPSLQEYRKEMQAYRSRIPKIEYDLNKNPRKYSEKWNKIR